MTQKQIEYLESQDTRWNPENLAANMEALEVRLAEDRARYLAAMAETPEERQARIAASQAETMAELKRLGLV